MILLFVSFLLISFKGNNTIRVIKAFVLNLTILLISYITSSLFIIYVLRNCDDYDSIWTLYFYILSLLVWLIISFILYILNINISHYIISYQYLAIFFIYPLIFGYMKDLIWFLMINYPIFFETLTNIL